MLGCKSIDSPMDVDQAVLLEDVGKYVILVEKLNYLTVTNLDITLIIIVVSQFLIAPRTTHLEAIMKILRYLKKAP